MIRPTGTRRSGSGGGGRAGRTRGSRINDAVRQRSAAMEEAPKRPPAEALGPFGRLWRSAAVELPAVLSMPLRFSGRLKTRERRRRTDGA